MTKSAGLAPSCIIRVRTSMVSCVAPGGQPPNQPSPGAGPTRHLERHIFVELGIGRRWFAGRMDAVNIPEFLDCLLYVSDHVGKHGRPFVDIAPLSGTVQQSLHHLL